jgi:predicted nucleic acid-binding protein
MSDASRTPLFVDTGGFYAVFDEDDAEHDRSSTVFDGIRDGSLSYGPVYTSRYVLSELATLMLYNIRHSAAVEALDTVLGSSTFNVLPVDPPTFAAAREQFEQYDDQAISFVDHLGAVLARGQGIDHVFAFDSDFATLGFTRVPVDTEEN